MQCVCATFFTFVPPIHSIWLSEWVRFCILPFFWCSFAFCNHFRIYHKLFHFVYILTYIHIVLLGVEYASYLMYPLSHWTLFLSFLSLFLMRNIFSSIDMRYCEWFALDGRRKGIELNATFCSFTNVKRCQCVRPCAFDPVVVLLVFNTGCSILGRFDRPNAQILQ